MLEVFSVLAFVYMNDEDNQILGMESSLVSVAKRSKYLVEHEYYDVITSNQVFFINIHIY